MNDKQKEISFVNFMTQEGFISAMDKVGSFQTNMPLYYKQINNNNFLVFNIPFYKRIKTATFQTDFWLVKAASKKEFLNKRLESQNNITIKLGFDLDKHLHLYYQHLQ